MICVRCCTENLAIAVVASRLLELPVFCTEDADVSADTRKLLAILHWNCEKCDANQKRCLLTFTIKVWNVCTAFTVKANGLCFWLFLTFSKLHYSLERNWEVFVQVGSFQSWVGPVVLHPAQHDTFSRCDQWKLYRYVIRKCQAWVSHPHCDITATHVSKCQAFNRCITRFSMFAACASSQ